MKYLLLPLLASLAYPTAVNANVDPKVAEICMKAVDFKKRNKQVLYLTSKRFIF